MNRGSTLFMLFLLMAFFSSALLAAGCGGEEGADGQKQGAGEKADRQQERGESETGNRPELKIALGTIRSVNAENEAFRLKPSAEAQGEKPMLFKLGRNASITLDGEEAQLSDMKPGQQAQVEYIVKEEWKIPNRARVVELFSAGGG